jgi:glyoxylase-like metal-dependent hydrolase (beta-lactamase superfamily II)
MALGEYFLSTQTKKMERVALIKIHNIGSYIVNNYLLETPIGIIGIDTGYPGGFAKYKKRFEKLFPLSKLKFLVLTHHHDDHSGFLNELVAATDAKVILHSSAIPLLAAGKNDMPPGSGYSSLPARAFGVFKKDFSFEPVVLPQERIIAVDSEQQQPFEELNLPLKILTLPGHTADHIGLYSEEQGIIFCGDAAMNAIISVARHTIWIDDKAEFGRSWDKMISCNAKKIYPAHGSPFSPSDLIKYRHFLGKQS